MIKSLRSYLQNVPFRFKYFSLWKNTNTNTNRPSLSLSLTHTNTHTQTQESLSLSIHIKHTPSQTHTHSLSLESLSLSSTHTHTHPTNKHTRTYTQITNTGYILTLSLSRSWYLNVPISKLAMSVRLNCFSCKYKRVAVSSNRPLLQRINVPANFYRFIWIYLRLSRNGAHWGNLLLCQGPELRGLPHRLG